MRAATGGQIHFGFVNQFVGINGQIACFPLSQANIHTASSYTLLRNNPSSLINADSADDVSTGALAANKARSASASAPGDPEIISDLYLIRPTAGLRYLHSSSSGLLANLS